MILNDDKHRNEYQETFREERREICAFRDIYIVEYPFSTSRAISKSFHILKPPVGDTVFFRKTFRE